MANDYTNAKGETMTSRRQAEVNYKAALKNLKAAESIGEAAWLAADEALTVARRELVAAEIAQPTGRETTKANRILMTRNRGLEVGTWG